MSSNLTFLKVEDPAVEKFSSVEVDEGKVGMVPVEATWGAVVDSKIFVLSVTSVVDSPTADDVVVSFKIEIASFFVTSGFRVDSVLASVTGKGNLETDPISFNFRA